MLQGQKYHTLSSSQIIQQSLIKYYNNLITSSSNESEKKLAEAILNSANHYLVEKLNQKQKKASLVCIQLIY